MYKGAAGFDALRSVSGASITSSYVLVGSELTYPAAVVAFTNATDGIVYVSTDGVTDMLALPPSMGKVFDIKTNSPYATNYLFPASTGFLIKYSGSATTTGAFYIECLLVKPN